VIPVAILVLGGWALVLAGLERVFPATVWPRDDGRVRRNLALGALALLVSPLVQMATLAVMGAVTGLRSGGVVPLIPINSVIVHLLILDIWAYALHRAYHRVPLMWRLHRVHHLDAHLDVTSAVRFHVGEILWSSVLRLIPLSFFGIPLEVNLLYGAILSGSAMFHHSNLRLPPALERALSRVIVTPSIHWVHHHAVQRDTDAHYASILSVWDHVFRSTTKTQRTPDMVIGVEGAGETTLAALLVHPFRE
jgi:sterol desaturase/sphingolipid hydroxylase (fatty acid hydroxylase superfamily)